MPTANKQTLRWNIKASQALPTPVCTGKRALIGLQEKANTCSCADVLCDRPRYLHMLSFTAFQWHSYLAWLLSFAAALEP